MSYNAEQVQKVCPHGQSQVWAAQGLAKKGPNISRFDHTQPQKSHDLELGEAVSWIFK